MQLEEGRPRRFAPSFVRASAVIWTTLVLYQPLWPSAVPSLDPSWSQGLSRALADGLVWGRDIVFPYGPMGGLWAPLFEPGLTSLHFVWELTLKTMQAIVVTHAVYAWAPRRARLLVFAMAITSVGVSRDAAAFVTIVAGALLLARETRPRPALMVAVIGACALLPLQKFTYLLLALVSFVSLAVSLAAQGRRRESVIYPLAVTATFVVAWAGVGQPLAAIPDFLRTSWEITSGYSQAMSAPYIAWERRLGLMATAAGLALIATGASKSRSLQHASQSVIAVAGIFVAWKAGFVRSPGHTQTTFAFALLSPLWIGALPWLGRRWQATGAAVLVTLGAAGLAQSDRSIDWISSAGRRPLESWRELHAPSQTIAGLESRLAETRAEHTLPRIRARVRDASIDVVPWHTAALFLNDLDWQPRPIFQSYTAYTPDLVRLNARHFRGEERPRFVLTHDGTIDGRHPMHDDGEAWLEILRRYEPVLYEDGYLLFEERSSAPAPADPVAIKEIALDLGEELDLTGLIDDHCYVGIQIGLEESLLGRMRSLLDRTPEVQLELRFGSAPPMRRRVVPGIAERGFLITPAATSTATWLFHFGAADFAPPTALTLRVERRHRKFFEPRATLRLLSYDGYVARDCSRAHSLGPLPGFTHTPDLVEPPWSFSHYDKSPSGLLAHASSRMVFELPAGTHDIRLGYAIADGAHLEGATDGVVFRARLHETDGRGETLLFERLLAPVTNAHDRGLHRYDCAIELTSPGRLVLETDPGPDGDTRWDWSIWTDVEITERVVTEAAREAR